MNGYRTSLAIDLMIGTCKITVATDDGNKTASCVVTVSGTVGIEQIINDHQIYCERGVETGLNSAIIAKDLSTSISTGEVVYFSSPI